MEEKTKTTERDNAAVERNEAIQEMKGDRGPAPEATTDLYPGYKRNLFKTLLVLTPGTSNLTREKIEPILTAHAQQPSISKAIEDLNGKGYNYVVIEQVNERVFVNDCGFNAGISFKKTEGK